MFAYLSKFMYKNTLFNINTKKKPHQKIPDNGTLKVSANPDAEVTFVVGPKIDSVTIPIDRDKCRMDITMINLHRSMFYH